MGSELKKRTIGALFVLLLVGTFGLAYGVGQASAQLSSAVEQPRVPTARQVEHVRPATDPSTPVATPSAPAPSAKTRHQTETQPKRTPTPKPAPKPAPIAGPRLLGPGNAGDQVRDLQARLKQIGWYSTDVSGTYGTVTTAAVQGFQAKRRLPANGVIDQQTLDRLAAMTRTPTSDELKNIKPTPATTTGTRLDARCTTGHALCIDKRSQTLRWVVDGRTRGTYAVRFGASYSPTREGLFHIDFKSADFVSTLYGSAMPYSMFFSGGQAVHYSSDFAARGYAGASHGCVNVRDYNGIKWLFSQARVGDKVVVYWS